MVTATPESVGARELTAFCRQFASMSKANVNLLDILRTLAQQTENEWFRRILASVRRDVEYGRSLASALSRFPADFSPFFIQMVRQGEVEGNLDEVFQSLSQYLEHEQESAPVAMQGVARIDAESILLRSRLLFAWLSLILAGGLLGAGGLWFLTLGGWLPERLLGPELLMLSGVIFLMAALAFLRFRPGAGRRCSFCGREESQGAELVSSGPDVAICSSCVAYSARQLRDRPRVGGQVGTPIPDADGERIVDI